MSWSINRKTRINVNNSLTEYAEAKIQYYKLSVENDIVVLSKFLRYLSFREWIIDCVFNLLNIL